VASNSHQKKLKEIGIRIRKLREKEKISRAQLAYEIDTSESQLARIEYGEVNTGLVSLLKIANVLDVDVKVFF